MKTNIILIGPVGIGKSTIAELISMKTGLLRRSLDELRWHYYDEICCDRGLARQKWITEGFWGLYRYWKPFEAYAVKRILEDFDDCIFDFGGGHSVYEDEALFEQVRTLLSPYPNVVLVIPSPDRDESIRILNERNNFGSDSQREVNEHFIRHPSNYDLAKHIVYTRDKEPKEICEEILKQVPVGDGL